MNALTMTMRATESINGQTEQAEATHCLHCGKPLSMFRKMKDNRFCGDEHQRSWHLQRLTRALAHD
jgi:hypothetical protein